MGRGLGQSCAVCGAAQEARAGKGGCRKPSDSEPPNPQGCPRGGAHRKSAAACLLAVMWRAGVLRSHPMRNQWGHCIGDRGGTPSPPPGPMASQGCSSQCQLGQSQLGGCSTLPHPGYPHLMTCPPLRRCGAAFFIFSILNLCLDLQGRGDCLGRPGA